MTRNNLDTIKHFIRFCKEELNIQSLPNIKLINDRSFVEQFRSYGEYNVHENSIKVYYPGRNLADVCRSLAHELVHHRQKELNMIGTNSGETGSEIENEANALAGIIMRDYGKLNLSVYDLDAPLREVLESKQSDLEEKIVKVPQEVLSKVGDLYNYVDKIKSKVEKKGTLSYTNPYIDSKLKKFFQLKDLKGQDLNITVGLYNDPEDAGAGRMDTTKDILLINLPFFSDAHEFEDTIEHEIVHAMDPKVRDVHIFGKMYAKKGAEPDQYDKYVKSPWEFDAFTAPLVNKLKYTIDKLGDKKRAYINLLIQLFSDLRTKDYDTVIQDEKYVPLAWLFTKKEWNEENWDAAWSDYSNELNKISRWVTKPTLYKQFLKRLGTEIA